MTTSYTIKNLYDVEDSAAKFGFGEFQESRFANDDLGLEQTGLSLHRVKPGARQPFAHRHEVVEEVYLVLSGSGRVKLEEEVVEVSEHDAIRVPAGVTRAFEAGPEGLEVLAVGALRSDDRGEIIQGWWRD